MSWFLSSKSPAKRDPFSEDSRARLTKKVNEALKKNKDKDAVVKHLLARLKQIEDSTAQQVLFKAELQKNKKKPHKILQYLLGNNYDYEETFSVSEQLKLQQIVLLFIEAAGVD